MHRWQKARELANLIHRFSGRDAFAKDFELRNQIRFLKMARGSASEVQSQLSLALGQGHIGARELEQAYALATETKRLINGMMPICVKTSANLSLPTHPTTQPPNHPPELTCKPIYETEI